MSITIRSMIDTPRQQAAIHPPHRHAQTPFRLVPRWNHVPGSRLIPRWTRLIGSAIELSLAAKPANAEAAVASVILASSTRRLTLQNQRGAIRYKENQSLGEGLHRQTVEDGSKGLRPEQFEQFDRLLRVIQRPEFKGIIELFQIHDITRAMPASSKRR